MTSWRCVHKKCCYIVFVYSSSTVP